MLKVNLFASLREELGVGEVDITLPDGIASVSELISHLIAEKGQAWSILQDESRVLVAIDQSVADRSSSILNAQEVAFFPPMTGG